MRIIFDGPPDERQLMQAVADQLAKSTGDQFKSAHTVLQAALDLEAPSERPSPIRKRRQRIARLAFSISKAI